MESSDRVQLPRLNIIHVMIIAGVLAVVFYALSSNPRESVLGVTILICVIIVALILWSLRPNPLKAVLANLPDEPAEKIAALEQGLAICNPNDVNTNAVARYRLMELYKVDKRYQEAIDQGRTILRLRGLDNEVESEVRLELAVCLDFLGRTEESEVERMDVDGCRDDLPEVYLDWLIRGKLRDKQHRYGEAA
jgi:hypothetical protein